MSERWVEEGDQVRKESRDRRVERDSGARKGASSIARVPLRECSESPRRKWATGSFASSLKTELSRRRRDVRLVGTRRR